MWKTALVFLFLIFGISLVGIYYSWYINWGWFDIVEHFLGGFFMAMLMTDYLKNHLLPGEKIKNTLIIIGATIFIGVIWEFCEYIANQTLIGPTKQYLGITAYFMGDLNDTVVDMMLDILGALTLVLYYNFRNKNSSQIK